MQLKSYFSGTVEAAMELARKELGDEALLVNARPATPETRYLGAYEVVFGLVPRVGAAFADAVPTPAKAMAAAAGTGGYGLPSHTRSAPVTQSVPSMNLTQPQAPPDQRNQSVGQKKFRLQSERRNPVTTVHPQPNQAKHSNTRAKLNDTTIDDRFRNDVQQLRLQIGQLTATARPSREVAPQVEISKTKIHKEQTRKTEISDKDISKQETSPTLKEVAVARTSPSPRASAATRRDRTQNRESRTARRIEANVVATDPTLGRPSAASVVVALVGPPGAGKTTTLVKLAVRYGLSLRRSVHILTTDTHRIAAADQLRSLAAILGVSCEVVETPQALDQALDRNLGKGLILIDTPGLAARDLDESAELMQMLARRAEIDTHLVLPASMKFADMLRIAKQYAGFQPAKLLFTRMDETTQYAGLVRAANSLTLPVSFLTNGQEIPDDLEEASEITFTAPASATLPDRLPSRSSRNRTGELSHSGMETRIGATA